MPATPLSTLIPREAFFGNPTRTGARISPDGSRLAFVAPVDGVMNAWVGPAQAIYMAEPVTSDTTSGVRYVQWSADGTHLLYSQSADDEGNWHVFATNIETKETRDLTPVEGASVSSKYLMVNHNTPDEIIIGINDRDVRFYDLYRISISTGERELLMQNSWGEDSGFIEIHTDNNNVPRLAIETTPDGGGNLLSSIDGADWKSIRHINSIDIFPFEIHGFSTDNQNAYIISSRDRDTSAVYALDLDDGTQTLIGANDRADIDALIIHPTQKKVEAFSVEYDREEWATAEPEIAKTLAFIAHAASGDFKVVSRSADGRHWIVHYDQVTAPGDYYLIDSEERTARRLFTSREALKDAPLAKMHPRIIKTRDGLDLVSYLTLPTAADPDQDGWPDTPVPMVLYVHGGPWYRDHFGYNPTHQWLANRGYAVLSVNYRGSLGFGKEFVESAVMEMGAKMQDDLIDAVDWAIATDITTPDGVAIAGDSYGGYAALQALTRDGDRFACGVDNLGFPNLITLIESFPEKYEPVLEATWYRRVGDPRTDEGREQLKEISPYFHADKISKPLLMAHGDRNVQVLQSETEEIVETLEAQGVPVTYLHFKDEAMGLGKRENVKSLRAITEVFLANCLGGDFEPINGALKGSTLEVRAGAEHIEGLAEAIANSQSE